MEEIGADEQYQEILEDHILYEEDGEEVDADDWERLREKWTQAAMRPSTKRVLEALIWELEQNPTLI